MLRILKKIRLRRKPQNNRVEREIWYEFVARTREWDYQWQNYLAGLNDKKPMSRDEFIDKMIKVYKLSDREQKKS